MKFSRGRHWLANRLASSGGRLCSPKCTPDAPTAGSLNAAQTTTKANWYQMNRILRAMTVVLLFELGALLLYLLKLKIDGEPG